MADPYGADLCSGTTNGNTLSDWGSAWTEREITLGAGTAVVSGTQYAIVVRAPDAPAFSTVYWNYDAGYANGDVFTSVNSGGSWTQDVDTGCWFKTKATAVEKDTHTAPAGWTSQEIEGADWAAMVFTASSSYTLTSVILKLAKFTLTSPGTITVSIKATQGLPTKATTPAPTNTASDVTLDQATLTWVDGGDSDTYNVYYGDTSGALSLVSSAQAGLSFTVTGVTLGSPYEYIITRYWRIDSTNEVGTTTGNEWSFTTIRFVPPGVTYWHSTSNTYYRLLVQSDGTYGDHIADGGVENTDYVVVTYEPNFIRTNRVLVAIAENRFWYEEIT